MVTILVKLGVMAAIASLLIRFGAFKRLLYREELSLKEKLIFALLSGMLLSSGVIVRLLLNYDAADLSLSGTLLVGLLAGPLTGAAVGLMVGAPAAFNGELLALPLGVLYGVSGGIVRELCRKEDIWSFSPLIFLNLYRIGKNRDPRPNLRLADRDFRGVCGTRIAPYLHRRGARSQPRVPFVVTKPVGAARDLHQHARCSRHTSQDLEQRTPRAQACRAGSARGPRKTPGPFESNQPTLPFQHLELDRLGNPYRSRCRASFESTSCRPSCGSYSRNKSTSSP